MDRMPKGAELRDDRVVARRGMLVLWGGFRLCDGRVGQVKVGRSEI
jgi:hypothetical protein